MADILGANYSLKDMFRLGAFDLDEKIKRIMVLSTGALCILSWLSQADRKMSSHVWCFFSVSLYFSILAVIFNYINIPFDAGSYLRGLLVLVVPSVALLSGSAIYCCNGLGKVCNIRWSLLIILAIMPYAYVFGSANNYWWQSLHAGIFWVLAGIVFIGPIPIGRGLTPLLLTLGLAIQLVTTALIKTGIEAPYGEVQALRENDYEIEIGKPGSKLLLSKGFGRFLSSAIELGKQFGFKEGTPMIDLGGSPSTIYAIGARSPGQAYFLGGYPGSDKLAIRALQTVSCNELSIAWVLSEPGGTNPVSPNILKSFGANIVDDYELVGIIKGTLGADDMPRPVVAQYPTLHKDMRMYRPIRSAEAATIACNAARGRS